MLKQKEKVLQKPVITIIAFWVIAIIVTWTMMADKGVFTFLGSLYAICMIGSVKTIQKAIETESINAQMFSVI